MTEDWIKRVEEGKIKLRMPLGMLPVLLGWDWMEWKYKTKGKDDGTVN